MRRKTKAFVLTIIMMIALVGCGGKDVSDGGTNAFGKSSSNVANEDIPNAEEENKDIPADAMKIGTVEDLEEFVELVNGGKSKLNAMLTADLDLSAKYGEGTEGWQGIHSYNGIFDGDGHAISGFVMNFPDGNDVGFFMGCGEKSIIRNLEIQDAVYEIFFGGSIVGHTDGMVENCRSNAVIHGNQVGGIAGHSNLMKDSVFSGTIEATDSAGGICWSGYVVENCRNEGTLTCLEEKDLTSASAGGIAAVLFEYAKDCVNTGTVDGGIGNAGGIVAGGSAGGTQAGGPERVLDCRNEGIVSASLAGGIIGGSMFDSDEPVIINCENTGAVYGTGEKGYAAGIVGALGGKGQIINCSSTGSVESTYHAAGILVQTQSANKQRVVNCYSSGTITATGDSTLAYAYGISGALVMECRNCFTNADIQTSSRSCAIRGGKQSEEDGCYYVNTIRQIDKDGEIETPGALAAEAFTDGTLLQLLNDAVDGIEGELCSWKQGEQFPVFDWQ
ncbi:MAG: hypothetical protein Q4E24_15220 [bacterium]|nr:hypothetical protein [bacterium]